MSKNPHTGDSLRTKELTQQGKDNWDKIFGKKEKKDEKTDSACATSCGCSCASKATNTK